MAIECSVITLLMLFIVGAFIRARRKMWALATLPLFLVPSTHAISIFVMTIVLKLEVTLALAAIPIIIALVVSCTWIGFVAATMIRKKKSRISYLAICVGFDVILSLILISSYYFSV
mgnify:CR=1 FL=1